MQLQKYIQADMGGTEIFTPLESVFKNRLSGCHSRQVIKSFIRYYQISVLYSGVKGPNEKKYICSD